MPVPFLLRVLILVKSPDWVPSPARLMVLGVPVGSSVPWMAVWAVNWRSEPVSRLTVREPRAPASAKIAGPAEPLMMAELLIVWEVSATVPLNIWMPADFPSIREFVPELLIVQ